jgi:CRP/FNR family cyclic AMP-dependent transcriptional regulator
MFDREKIAKFEIFEGLNANEIDNILSLCQEVACQDTEIIFENSSLSSDFFILLEGRVSVEIDVSHMDKNGREKVQLAILRTGNVFGEIGFLGGKRRSASVKAIEKVLVLKINGKKLEEYFAENKHTGYRVMRNLALILAQRITDVIFMLRDDIRRTP